VSPMVPATTSGIEHARSATAADPDTAQVAIAASRASSQSTLDPPRDSRSVAASLFILDCVFLI
jgi:hypothetical protein